MSMEQKGMEYLKQKLAKFSLRGTTRYRYYDMKVNDNKRNLLMPVEIQGRYRSCIGWCSKAVDALADRLVFREFANDVFGLNEIFEMNSSDIFFDSAILIPLFYQH